MSILSDSYLQLDHFSIVRLPTVHGPFHPSALTIKSRPRSKMPSFNALLAQRETNSLTRPLFDFLSQA
jgi:hypothetical protein